MINKTKVGSRICSFRKAKGYSQTEFAEKLGISAQAVSKWEKGLALPDVEVLLNISWMFKISINEILEGNNIFTKITNRPFTFDDIAYFVSQDESDFNIEWAKQMVRDGWIMRNWEEVNKNFTGQKKYVGKMVAEHGGLILELGAGPGGGYMPEILSEKFNANLIISDISPTVVREWKKFFDKGYNPPNVFYAVLDNCDLPFIDNSIDVISIGGFKNTDGDKCRAILEIYRVLKPGGLFLSGDGMVTQVYLKSLPEHVQKILLEKRPDIFEDYYEATVTAGFNTIDSRVCGGWSTKDDESTIADLARELGVELYFTAYLRYCIK